MTVFRLYNMDENYLKRPSLYSYSVYSPDLDYAGKNNAVTINNIIILSFAHTHKMQPMDVAVYGALKAHFQRKVNVF